MSGADAISDIIGLIHQGADRSGATNAANMVASDDPLVQDAPGAPVGSGLQAYWAKNYSDPLPTGLQGVIATKQASAAQQVGQDFASGNIDQPTALLKIAQIKGEDPTVTIGKIAQARAYGWIPTPSGGTSQPNGMAQQAPALASMGTVQAAPVTPMLGGQGSQGDTAPNLPAPTNVSGSMPYPGLQGASGLLNGNAPPSSQTAQGSAPTQTPLQTGMFSPAALQAQIMNGGDVMGLMKTGSEMQKNQAEMQKDTAQADEATANAQKSRAGLPPTANPQIANSNPNFGFPVPQKNTPAYAEAVKADTSQQQAANSNAPFARNSLGILDNLEPDLKNYPTGGRLKPLYQDLIGVTDPNGVQTIAGANIEKNTAALATELGKFERAPGSRGSDMQLANIIASKPSITQPAQTNANIVAELRGRINDYNLSSELQQKYREASPAGITDSNTDLLDNALKAKFPLMTTNPKTGEVAYHPENVDKIRAAIPDAIANPQKYMTPQTQEAQSAPQASAPQRQLTPVQQALMQEYQKRKAASGGQ